LGVQESPEHLERQRQILREFLHPQPHTLPQEVAQVTGQGNVSFANLLAEANTAVTAPGLGAGSDAASNSLANMWDTSSEDEEGV
jgi:hypothetical protein